MSTTQAISAIILAGGEGRRAGGRDKGLIEYRGRPLIEHVLARIRPQVNEIIISANRNIDRYRQYSDQVVSDESNSYRGPLAGIDACLPHCQNPLALVAACDMPQLPDDLAPRLYIGLADRDLAIASIDGHHQLALLLKTTLRDSIHQRLADDRLKLIEWIETQDYSTVSFDDKAGAFANLNHLPTE